MQEYWHKLIGCPFYITNRRRMLECEMGRLYPETKEGINHLMDNFCVEGYEECPLYQVKQIDYDIEEREENEKRRQLKSRNQRA